MNKASAPQSAASLVDGPLPEANDAARPGLPTALVAVRLLALRETAGDAGLIFIAGNERRADEIGRALAGFAPDGATVVLRPWDCLPYDRAAPSRECMGSRMAALAAIARERSRGAKGGMLLVTSPEAAMQRLPPSEASAAHFEISVGMKLDREALSTFAARAGYVADERIEEPGEIAILGQVVDAFPANAAAPVRIALDADDHVEEIHIYDPATQRTDRQVDDVRLGPASEAVTEAKRSEGTEHRLWEVYSALWTIFDLMPDAAMAMDEDALQRCRQFREQIAEAYETRRTYGGVEGIATPQPDRLYLSDEDLAQAVAARHTIALPVKCCAPTPSFVTASRPTQAARRFIRGRRDEGARVVLTGLAHEQKLLARAFRFEEDKPVSVSSWAAVAKAKAGSILALEADCESGFIDDGAKIVCIAASDVFGARTAVTTTVTNVFHEADMRAGDVVVHEDHGFGILQGLERISAGDGESDAIRLDYHGGARLIVPVDEFDRIWRYGSEPDAVTLDRLHTDGWIKRRIKVEGHVADTATSLIALARERADTKADTIVPDRAAMARFAARFPFPETADQAAAIAAILSDLASGKPMNRLLCGDVGFGKTEVALRAAAAVALCGRQVALVAPTTVLVRQHVQVFQRRFAGTNVAIIHLSRIVSPAEIKTAKTQLAEAGAAIVIGTQAVLGKDVTFADLGLVIIDEEHRFGTKTKEMLRHRAPHLLALSATPIPRTLQSALVGVQEVSVLATPPARRRPIRTFLAPFDAAAVRTALLREKRRGGQSFVVVPRIADIEPLKEQLAQLVPDLEIGVAHGELDSEEIDAVMVAFGDGERDVLLATNMIESGLDVPRANTMLIWRADRFGLAGLHQLRGRVGRGRVQGVVYLLTDPDDDPSDATRERLATLETFNRLGAGFAISARDLDLRGGGDLVGEEQAGHMRLIGASLYRHLLAHAVDAAKGGKELERRAPELQLGSACLIPEDYVPEEATRIDLYLRFARMDRTNEIDAFEEELNDRFGPVPEPVCNLLALGRLRALGGAAGATAITFGPKGVAIALSAAAANRVRAADPSLPDTHWNGNRLIVDRTEAADETARREAVTGLLEALAP